MVGARFCASCVSSYSTEIGAVLWTILVTNPLISNSASLRVTVVEEESTRCLNFGKPHRSLLCVENEQDVQQFGLSKEADEVVNAGKNGVAGFSH